jgi:predicted MFS family arabinose efflux permease
VAGLALLACSAGTLAAFVWHQRRTPHPLMRLDLFRHRRFALGALVAFVYGAALVGSTYLLPVFMQVALSLPPSQAGAVLLPAGIALAITIPLVGRSSTPSSRAAFIFSGLVLLALSFALMLVVGRGTALR